MYLVTGGREVNKTIALDSTEILTEGDDNWKLTGSLPMALVDIRGVSLQDRILMTGKYELELELDLVKNGYKLNCS